MDFFIKKIFDNEFGNDELVHLQFQKFSRGNFNDRAILIAKYNSDKFSVSTTAEYANEFVRVLAEKLGDNKTHVTGVIVSTKNLKGELDYQSKKQFMGVNQYIINKEMSGKDILELCNKLPTSFIGLSFNANNSELKIKPKAPKSGKPSSRGEETPKVDFCKLKTFDKEIINNLIFDKEVMGFKEIEIKHDFIIDEIIVPSENELKIRGIDKNDFAKIRELAVRKGKIIRKIKVDGEKVIKEKEFEV